MVVSKLKVLVIILDCKKIMLLTKTQITAFEETFGKLFHFICIYECMYMPSTSNTSIEYNMD